MSATTRAWTDADILRAVDRLDFGRICTAMTALGWRWVNAECGGVPTEGEVRRSAIDLTRYAVDEFQRGGERVRCASGGLSAFVSASEIRVEFVLSKGIVEREEQ